MKKLLFLAAVILAALSCNKENNSRLPVVTGGYSDVEYSSAKLYGYCNLKYDSYGRTPEFGIEISLDENMTDVYSMNAGSRDSDNRFCCEFTGLRYDMSFFYRAFAVINGKKNYGEVKTFSLKKLVINVTTEDAVDVKGNSALLKGKLENADELAKDWKRVQFYYGLSMPTEDELLKDGVCLNATLNEDGTFSAPVNSLIENSTYYFLACVLVLDTGQEGYGRKFCGEVKTFKTGEYIKDEPEAVDLGLKVKWASFNVGASCPEGYGDYFAWGETSTKTEFFEKNYKWYDGGSYTKYTYADNKMVLDPEDDVAHVRYGGNWRMPTGDEFNELVNNCDLTWTTMNGVIGCKVSGKKAGYKDKWIFLPAAGYCVGSYQGMDVGIYGHYWSASIGGWDGYAGCMEFTSGPNHSAGFNYLNYSCFPGYSVRAVSK